MPLINRRRYRFITPGSPATGEFFDFSAGLNNRDSDLTLKDNELSKAENVRYGTQGSFKKRPGSRILGQKLGTSTKILGLHSYVKKDTTAELLTTFNTDIYKYTASAANASVNAAVSVATGMGYSKDRHVFTTTAHLDTNGNPFTVVMYQSGSGITLEWEDSPYDTWTNTAIVVDTSTQIGWSGYMDALDNIHIVYMSGADTIKYVKLTYGAGPTWSVGSKITIKGTGASDSATSPSITVQASGRIHTAFRYYNGTTYSVHTMYSEDSGATWGTETVQSTPSTNARHFALLSLIQGFPILFYQVGETSVTSYYFRFWTGTWSPQSLAESATLSTDRAFSGVVTGNNFAYVYSAASTSSGVSMSAFGSLADAERRRFAVINDGANDNDIIYYNTINDNEDTNFTRVSNDSLNNVSPSSPEYVASSASYLPVAWITGTTNPWTIKVNTLSNWQALSASLTADQPMESAYFPKTSAGGTDQIYLTNGVDSVKKWDGTTLTSATATGYPKPKWIVQYQNRMWMGNNGSSQNRAYYTDLGADNFSGTFPSGNTVDFPEYTVWGHAYYDKLLVFTRSKVYVVQNFDYSGASVGPEKIRPLPNSFGTLSGRTVVQVGYWVYFQSPDGFIRRTNGQYVELVADKVRGTTDNLAKTLLTTAAAGSISNYYYLAVADSASGQNNIWIVLDTTTNELPASIDTGKFASCFVAHPDSSGVPTLYFGESRVSNGSVYQGEVGGSDNGNAIDMLVETGIKTFRSIHERKLFKHLHVLANASGDYTLTVGYAGFKNVLSFTTYLIDLATNAPIWGAFVWGSAVWGGIANIDNSREINLRDRMVKYQFSQSGVDQDVEVFGFSQSYAIIKDER